MMLAARTAVRSLGLIARPLPSAASARLYSAHKAESDEEFNKRWVDFFVAAPDAFEVQRGLTNVFSHDLVPGAQIVEAALRAARRHNDFPATVRVFEAIKEKVDNEGQYRAYLNEFKPLMDELGINTVEELYH